MLTFILAASAFLDACHYHVLPYDGPGVLRATGISTTSASKVAACRAARFDARENLYEKLLLSRIDKNTTVRDCVDADPQAERKIRALLRKASVVRETKLPNGKYEVELQINLPDAYRYCK